MCTEQGLIKVLAWGHEYDTHSSPYIIELAMNLAHRVLSDLENPDFPNELWGLRQWPVREVHNA
jgi:hypothetical protein